MPALSLFPLTFALAAQPQIELAPPEIEAQPQPRPPAARPPLGVTLGGYGELTLNAPDTSDAVVDLRRLVLFFGYNFTDRLRFYSEVEIEHAVSSADDRGEVEVEQAYLDGLLRRRLNLRGGILLMPVGIINVYHEPPTFNGVDRPDVDTFVIPSTWREPGIGLFGELAERLRYQLFFVDGMNANGFTAGSAVREGHQEAELAHAGDVGGVGRLDWEPVAGSIFGLSLYGATSGNSLGPAAGRVPVILFEADARTRRGGFEARAELAFLFILDAAELDTALGAGSMEQRMAVPVSSQARGGYGEVGYDLLRLLAPWTQQSLTAFGRFDYADTQAAVPAGFAPNLAFRRYSEVFGLVWRPIPNIAIKGDYRRREFGAGPDANEGAFAITWMF